MKKHSKSIIIITQVIDQADSNLGFFCEWVTSFAEQLDHVYVIANRVGKYTLPKNVTVLSLGKEGRVNRIGRIFNFWKYLIKTLPKSNTIFVHMCPEYIVYGAWVGRLFGKRLGLWYLHKSVSWKLRLSEKLVNNIFTAHKDGLKLDSNKIKVTGHGINTDLFSISKIQKNTKIDKLKLLTIGRVTESKNLLILAKTVILLTQKLNTQVTLTIVGEPYLEKDKQYKKTLVQFIKDNNIENSINFVGKVDHKNIASFYLNSDVFINASKTGGVDKAVLEAMVSLCPVITSNQAFQNILPLNSQFKSGDINDLVKKIEGIGSIDKIALKKYVIENHSIDKTTESIIKSLSP